MANFIDFLRGIASRLFDRRSASRAHESGCTEDDPAALIESLALPRAWITGAELADAYRTGCAGPV